MNVIFYVLILDKNKLFLICKIYIYICLKFFSKVLYIFRLFVEVNVVVILMNKIKCKLIIKNRK